MATISGSLRHRNNRPIANATLMLFDINANTAVSPPGGHAVTDNTGRFTFSNVSAGTYQIDCNNPQITHGIIQIPDDITEISDIIIYNTPNNLPINVRLTPSNPIQTPDIELWNEIRRSRQNFVHYQNYIDNLLTSVNASSFTNIPRTPSHRADNYTLLKYGTEQYIYANLGLNPSNMPNYGLPLPYIQLVENQLSNLGIAPLNTDNLNGESPVLIELIWSYYHEEGMLAQSMLAISHRFQNMRNGVNDPLANLAIAPLRRVNNILWGYIQDAQHRLTIVRRAHEYLHEYGLNMIGNAIPKNITPADFRSKFLESFNNLLNRCIIFFKEVDDTTRNADAFPILNALREVHRVLAEGAHNQFRDLPITSRIEMLCEMYILSQPEIREFLGGRAMVPYDEPWMDKVDTMKTLQSWDSVSVSYYHELAAFGEMIILSIRYGNWSQINNSNNAYTWALAFRDDIQRYVHSYHAVTGVDLSISPVTNAHVQPSVLINNRVMRERAAKRAF